MLQDEIVAEEDAEETDAFKLERMGLTPDWIIRVILKFQRQKCDLM